MLQLLDPGEILKSLRGDDPVTEQKLWLGRPRGEIDTEHIVGRLANFPLFRDGKGRQGAVEMEVWVEKKNSHVVALKVYPTGTDGEPRREQPGTRLRRR